MKFEELTNEQIEKAKACTTREEKLAFLKEYSIELPDDMLDEISGGDAIQEAIEKMDDENYCPNYNNRPHVYEKTGNKKEGRLFDEVEKRCVYCGKIIYQWW